MKSISIALLLTLIVCATPALAGRSINEHRPAGPDGMVVIENMSGSVVVKGWDKKEVAVTGTLAEDAERLDVTGTDGRIEIEVVFPKGGWNRRDNDSDLEITVPYKSRVHVKGVNATITSSGVDGSLDLQTVNGSITISGNPTKIDAQTVNGTVRVESSASDVKTESVSGDVVLMGVQGDVSASTVSGDIELSGGEFDDVECSTVSGEIRFEGAVDKTGSLDFECHSGSVVLVLPADISAYFELETFSGEIDNEFGPKAHRTSEYTPGKELDFSVGDGDARISVSSFSGSIVLKKK
jgi:DUF4097 and DUF4098 domain-containing protein YvlB